MTEAGLRRRQRPGRLASAGALHPGVAEEAGARVFIIPLLYWVFHSFARARTAIVAAALVGTYWFAFLHAPLSPVVVLLLATIQVLPMTYPWLRRGLEAAIGSCLYGCRSISRRLCGLRRDLV
jgi:hypothetical protein